MSTQSDVRNLRLARIVVEQRRRVTSLSLKKFAQLYLSHHLAKPPSRMHNELYPMLQSLRDHPGARIALAAPRGSAKSTLVTLVFVLWSICQRMHRFIVIISDTEEKAAGFLDDVKHELVENRRFAVDFPEVGEPRQPRRWRRTEIITGNGVKVAALGVGQNIRGRRHVEIRPDLIILDDAESPDNTNTQEGRAKIDAWFNRSIVKAGSPTTQILVVGTIQHYDGLLAKLTDPVKGPTWQSKIYRSIIRWSPASQLWQQWTNILRFRGASGEEPMGLEAAHAFFAANREAMLEGTEVLWPENEDYYSLIQSRETDGPAHFDAEKQNEPVNPQDCFFLEQDFQFWDDRWASERELIESFSGNVQFVGACDPSLGKEGRYADDSAIITLAQDTCDGRLYVLDADIARRKPDKIIDDILAYCRYRDYCRFGFEANQFQEFLATELERRAAQAGLYPSVEPIHHSCDKIGRIQSLQPLVRSGRLQISRKHVALLEQLRLFPKASHDDGPDALEMAVRTINQVGRPDDDDIIVIRDGIKYVLAAEPMPLS